jgi:hypothetical protein
MDLLEGAAYVKMTVSATLGGDRCCFGRYLNYLRPNRHLWMIFFPSQEYFFKSFDLTSPLQSLWAIQNKCCVQSWTILQLSDVCTQLKIWGIRSRGRLTNRKKGYLCLPKFPSAVYSKSVGLGSYSRDTENIIA